MEFKSLVLEEMKKRITPKLEEEASYDIARNWLKGGEFVLSRDPSARYIRLSDDLEHQLSVQYEDGFLKDCKYNKASNMRIGAKAKETALMLLSNTNRYPLMKARLA